MLYELPSVLSAIKRGGLIWVVEGEKDADKLNDLFRHEYGREDRATTAPMGAGKWRPEYSESLRGAHVVICGDADAAGWQHVHIVHRSLLGVAASVRVLDVESLFGEVAHGRS